MQYINWLTMNTGHLNRSTRDDVADDILKVVAPWVEKLSHGPMALPVQPLSHFSARAHLQDGWVVVTVYGPDFPHVAGKPVPDPGNGIPLAVFGVAQRSRHGKQLWDVLHVTLGQFCLPGLKIPDAPWIAAVPLPGAKNYPESLAWIADFERCFAWAWITRNPKLQVV